MKNKFSFLLAIAMAFIFGIGFSGCKKEVPPVDKTATEEMEPIDHVIDQ